MTPSIPAAYRNAITTGDSRELARALPDSCIDLVLTDPPYLKEDIQEGVYTWLGGEAARVLKPGGFLLTYVGSLWKYNNMLELGQHLTYFYDFVELHAGAATILWARHTLTRHKSILAFVKGWGQPRCLTMSAWTGSGADKRYHAWGQAESTARYYIDCFSAPGDLVWEPFCGGGTVPAVCQQIGRDYIAFERDPQTAETARQRLAQVQPMLPGLRAEQTALDLEVPT